MTNPIDMGGVTINSSGDGSNVAAVNTGSQQTTVHKGCEPGVEAVFEPLNQVLGEHQPTWDQVPPTYLQHESPDASTTTTPADSEFDSPLAMFQTASTEAAAEVENANLSHGTAEYDQVERTWLDRFKQVTPYLLELGVEVGSAYASSFVRTSPTVSAALKAFELAKRWVGNAP